MALTNAQQPRDQRPRPAQKADATPDAASSEISHPTSSADAARRVPTTPADAARRVPITPYSNLLTSHPADAACRVPTTSLPSLFANLTARESRPVGLEELYDIVRGAPHPAATQLRRQTEEFRQLAAQGRTDAAHRVKQNVVAFTPAVSCRGGRRADNVVGYTGLSLCDFDHFATVADVEAARAVVIADPHTAMAYVTMSGLGLRVIFAYQTPECPAAADAAAARRLYAAAFRTGNDYYARLVGHEADAQCKDATRLSALSYDARAYINVNATPIVVAIATPAPRRRPTAVAAATYRASASEAAQAASEALSRRGMAYHEGQRNHYISTMLYAMNRYGVPLAEATTWAQQAFADYGTEAVAAIAASCYNRTAEHGTRPLPRRDADDTATTPPSPTSRRSGGREWLVGLETKLRERAEFRRNIVRGRPEMRWRGADGTWSDVTADDINSLWRHVNSCDIAVKPHEVEAIISSDFASEYDPFMAYLDSLPEWDGRGDPIGDLARSVHVASDEELWRRLFTKWFVGIIPTMCNRHDYNEGILVLVGDQGIYKSSWLRRLVPTALQGYYWSKAGSSGFNKDDERAVAQAMLYNLEEINYVKPEDLDRLKGMVTAGSITDRRPYAHHWETYVRRASFCGSSNNRELLTDTTGNRRWLVFEVKSIDSPFTSTIDIDAAFAQAKKMLQDGFDFRITREEYAQLAKHNESFESTCPERELISKWYRVPQRGEACVYRTAADIIAETSGGTNLRLTPTRIGSEMRRLGFEKRRRNGCNAYMVVVRTLDEREAAAQCVAPDVDAPTSDPTAPRADTPAPPASAPDTELPF